MDSPHLHPETLEERLIFWAIAGTWGFYLIGGLYILSPALGWTLAAIATSRRLGFLPGSHYDRKSLPLGIWIWIVSMALMAVTLMAGHLNFELGAAQTLKSFIGWMKGWALMAVFAFIGATMRIRPAVIYRASGVLALQTLLLGPVFFIAPKIGLPGLLYVSPLQIVGGPGPEFFSVSLYTLEPTTGQPRWLFFAPWAPAAACIASTTFMFALFEKTRKWKCIGITAAIIVCLMSQSRMALLVIPAAAILVVMLSNLSRPFTFAASAAATVAILPFGEIILQQIEDAQNKFSGARAASSRVRATLQNIAWHRWQTEAPLFGHGTVERGPHLVEYMPIGSHHTWFGLLYVKGIAGLLTLAIPMAWTFMELVIKAQADRAARCALGILLVLLMFSFGENLEILVYLFWPGMIIIGIVTRRRICNPFAARIWAARPLGVLESTHA
jgi:O-Antigen ligase